MSGSFPLFNVKPDRFFVGRFFPIGCGFEKGINQGVIMSGYETLNSMITVKKCPKSMIDDYIELMQSVGRWDLNDDRLKKALSSYVDRFGFYEF